MLEMLKMPDLPISILAKAPEVTWKPFPHVVIKNALPDNLYQQLLETRLPWEEIMKLMGTPVGHNMRYDVKAAQLLKLPHVAKVWKDFAAYHVSGQFWRDFLGVFGEAIRVAHYRFSTDEPVGCRYLDHTPILLDCQMGINSPCLDKPSRVVGPHIDNPTALFAGLLYMGDEGGGNLQIMRWKGARVYKNEGMGHRIPDDAVEVVDMVPYAHNTFVGFINTPDSVHAVTERRSDLPRLLANFVVDSARGKIFNKYG
jgi:hypothetical protein